MKAGRSMDELWRVAEGKWPYPKYLDVSVCVCVRARVRAQSQGMDGFWMLVWPFYCRGDMLKIGEYTDIMLPQCRGWAAKALTVSHAGGKSTHWQKHSLSAMCPTYGTSLCPTYGASLCPTCGASSACVFCSGAVPAHVRMARKQRSCWLQLPAKFTPRRRCTVLEASGWADHQGAEGCAENHQGSQNHQGAEGCAQNPAATT